MNFHCCSGICNVYLQFSFFSSARYKPRRRRLPPRGWYHGSHSACSCWVVLWLCSPDTIEACRHQTQTRDVSGSLSPSCRSTLAPRATPRPGTVSEQHGTHVSSRHRPANSNRTHGRVNRCLRSGTSCNRFALI